jgi:chromosome segregation ATPase
MERKATEKKGRNMRRKMFLGVLLSVSLALLVAAQGRGPGAGAQRGGAAGSQPGQGGPEGGQRSGQAGAGKQGTLDQKLERIHATDQQRAQLKDCVQSADQVRERARQMAAAAKGESANSEEFRRRHEQLRQEIQIMQQERDRFMNGLTEEQRSTLQSRIRAMDRARDRLNDRLRLLNDEMGKPEPDRKRIRDHVTGVETAAREWQKQLREVSSEMGVRP